MRTSNTILRAKYPIAKKSSSGATKLKVTIDQIRLVLGKNWNIFKSESSSTQQRIIGLVSIHHRPKTIIVHGSKNCPRYPNSIATKPYFSVGVCVALSKFGVCLSLNKLILLVPSIFTKKKKSQFKY